MAFNRKKLMFVLLPSSVIFGMYMFTHNMHVFPLFKFNITSDVLVYIHIQKTGGKLLDQHLIHYLGGQYPCRCDSQGKHCRCMSTEGHIWLFSRLTSSWRCGVHPDWTELHECVPGILDRMEKRQKTKVPNVQRRYHYITMLRNPVERYISEWLHTRRGADWTVLHRCNHRLATIQEVVPCHRGSTWVNVTLKDFVACFSNPANNRQTRMLADLHRINCYNSSGMSHERRDRIMLSSALENLKNMSFFGLTDHYRESLNMFEKIFNVTFRRKSVKSPQLGNILKGLDRSLIDKIKQQNQLDIQLYTYAQTEFFSRLAD